MMKEADYFRPGELKKKIDYKQVGCVQCSKAKTEKKNHNQHEFWHTFQIHIQIKLKTNLVCI
jgi:hypothetical protein